MNEKIKELAEQAGLEMCGCGCNMPTRQSAKFVKLIIQEHLSVWEMMDNGNKVEGYIEMEDYPKAIKKYFGIE